MKNFMKPLNILGRIVKIKKFKNTGENIAGFYDFDTKEIGIDASLKKDDAVSTLIHEVGHALFHRGGLIQCNISREVQEIIVEQYATVLLDNFKLTRK